MRPEWSTRSPDRPLRFGVSESGCNRDGYSQEDNVQITTNHHSRDFVFRDEVPADVLADQFDYHDDDVIDGYFCYRGIWYHLDQFTRRDIDGRGYWHGFHADSFYSGIAIRLSDDGESYIVGTVIA